MIGFLSDFSGQNGYVGSMKAVAGRICDDRLVDISHNIPRHSVRKGAFVLKNSFSYFPSGSVFVCVVDPGVGTERRGIAIKSGDYYFVGPDNGLMFPAAKEAGYLEAHQLSNRDLMLDEVSETFHGRDVFAPIGAYLAKGVAIDEVGPEVKDTKKLGFGDWKKRAKSLLGEALFVDSFGNIITNIPYDGVRDILEFGDTVEVKKEKIPFCKSYGFVDRGELLLTVGGHGNLEISANRENAKDIIGLSERDELSIKIRN